MIDHQKNHVAFKWILIIVVLTVFQLSIFLISGNDLYWNIYDTSTDLIELVFAITLFLFIPYTSIKLKMITACLMSWYFYIAVSQIIINYIFQNTDNNFIGGIFATVFIIVTFLSRFIIIWRPNKTDIGPGYFYEVIGKPANISQLIVAMYTGRGGAFGITDGVDVWHYSKQHDSMICETFEPTYLMGRMVHKICETSQEKYDELHSMTGQKFTLMHNCLELHSISGKWK